MWNKEFNFSLTRELLVTRLIIILFMCPLSPWCKQHKRDWTLVNLKTLFEDVTNRNSKIISIKDSKTLKPLTSSLFSFINVFFRYIKHWTGKFCKHKQSSNIYFTNEHQSLTVHNARVDSTLSQNTNLTPARVETSWQYKIHQKQKIIQLLDSTFE